MARKYTTGSAKNPAPGKSKRRAGKRLSSKRAAGGRGKGRAPTR